jgi:hypothetical protein
MGSKARTDTNLDDVDVLALLSDLVRNAETLIEQQVRLIRSEVTQELQKAGGTVVSFGAGAYLLAAGGLMVPPMLIHLLHSRSRLPLWACYGLVAGVLGVTGAAVLVDARLRAAGLALPALPQTSEGLQENLTWLKDEMTSPRP